MQNRNTLEQQGRRRTLRIVGASAACVAAVAIACSSPIADQTAPPQASSTVKTPVATKGVVNVDQPYFEFQVEKQVTTAPGSPQPHYPPEMKSAGMEGEVLAQFIVDTLGRADMNTFKVLKSTNQQFTDAVKNVLPNMRFTSAMIGGQKVKQMVQQPFTFALSK